MKRTAKRIRKAKGERGKKKRMSCYDVAEIVVAKKIKTRTELLFFARQQKQEANRFGRIRYQSRV